MLRSTKLWTVALALTLSGLATPSPARAELPGAEAFLAAGGFSSGDVEEAKSGKIIHGSLPSSNDRELVATLAFIVKETPKELIERALDGLLSNVDPNVISWGYVEGAPSPEALAKLVLTPDGKSRAQRYGKASAATDLNLSPEEVASFAAIGPNADVEAVQANVRKTLAARLAAYQQKGLNGIPPYVRDGETRSASDDLRSATKAHKNLEKWTPDTHRMLLDYPDSKVAGSVERFSWSQINAHDEPTLILTHSAAVPEGDAWVVMQRQFYVSEGYNCEQAVAAFVPVKSGTAVFYVNRTSTDQVTGFGGGTKRSIGSKLLASQLEGIFERIQK